MARDIQRQPAKTAYIFGPGWVDISTVLTRVWLQIEEAQTKAVAQVRKYSQQDSAKLRLLIAIPTYFLWLARALTSLLASILFCMLMLIPQVCLYIIGALFVLIFTSAVYLIESIRIRRQKLSQVCDTCHSRYTLPVYLCGTCREKHTHLIPSKYGALHRTCNCGTKLASSILVRKNPRRDLAAICPICWEIGRETPAQGSGSRMISVPVVGGVSVGKSAFITAYTKSIIDTIAPQHGVSARFYNDENKDDFDKMMKQYQTSTIDKTNEVTDRNKASAKSFGFILEGKNIRPQRLIQLYDIAGETFVANQEHEKQRQYEHCEGIVLVIDPMALPQAEARFGHKLTTNDKSSVSSSPLEQVMRALIQDLREITANSGSERINTPLAVIINKVDESSDLDGRIGDVAVAHLKSRDAEKYSDEWNDMDFLCRQFLVDMDMPDIIDLIDQSFSNSRFFAISAIGHSAGTDEAFTPKNVNVVMDWIIGEADPALSKTLGCAQFDQVKLPIEVPGHGLFDQLMT